MVRAALEVWDLDDLDYLFIENVGNLVCPASFDLGEHLRALLFPVTDGEDKPLKYPTLINTADVTLISKADLTQAVGFDTALARRNVAEARPGACVLEVSARTGAGLGAWIELLEARREATMKAGSQPTSRDEVAEDKPVAVTGAGEAL